MHVVTESFRDQIESRIREYEKQCALEFVPVIVRSSGHYFWIRVSYSLLALIGVMVIARPMVSNESAFALTLAASTVAGIAAFFLTGWEPVLRRILPGHYKQSEVQAAAALRFLKEEVFDTPHRTGILIYVSLLERAVYLLADKGLTAKIPAQEWGKLGSRLAADFHRDSPGGTFLEALDEIVKRAAKDFPPEAERKNHLDEHLRED